MQEEEIVDDFVVQSHQSSSSGAGGGTSRIVKRRRGDSNISRRSFSLHLCNVPGSELLYSFVDVSGGDTTKLLALDIEHVMVPEAARGCKVAERLVKRAFQLAAEHSVPIIPTCTYVSNTFLSRYSELLTKTMTLADLLQKDAQVASSSVKKRRKRKPL